MAGVMDRVGVGGRGLGCGVLLLSVLMAGCGEVADPGDTVADSTPGETPIDEVIASIQAATPSPITPEQAAETFALGTNATDIQREMMKKELVGKVVEWDLVVYEVAYSEGRYELTSQPIPIASQDAVQLVHVLAYLQAQSLDDDAFLRGVKTGDPIRIRGLVQDIFLRTMVKIGPGVVVRSAAKPT
jgi:hypothetical protein